MAKDRNGNIVQVGDVVAVEPNSGCYGKWRIGTITKLTYSDDPKWPAKIREDCASCQVRYSDVVLKRSYDQVKDEIVWTPTYSFGTKSSQSLILLDQKTLLPVK